MDKTKYELAKLTNRKSGFPVATMAFYGPDDQFASKVAVGILLSEKDEEVADLRRWFSRGPDVRVDMSVIKEIQEFIKAANVHRVVMVDHIIGCPHEEGVDYPEGETCPQCPFWAKRDRWAGEAAQSEKLSRNRDRSG